MSEVKSKKLDLYECQCRNCPISDLCGLLKGQYCSYGNCIAQLPS